MQRIGCLGSRTIWLLAGVVLLSACSMRPLLPSALPSGDVQVNSAQSPSATPSPLIAPFVSGLQGPTSTATPDAFSTPHPPEYYYTPTPRPYTIVLNLAEGLPSHQVWRFSVDRADGHSDEYLVPLDAVPRDSVQHYFEYRDSLFQLGPGDRIVYEGLSEIYRTPAKRTPLPATPSSFPDIEKTPAAQTQTITQPGQILVLPLVVSAQD